MVLCPIGFSFGKAGKKRLLCGKNKVDQGIVRQQPPEPGCYKEDIAGYKSALPQDTY